MEFLSIGFLSSVLPSSWVQRLNIIPLINYVKISGGKGTKASILSAVCPNSLRWSINIACACCTCTPFVHRVKRVQLEVCKGVKHTSMWQIHLPCWEPISSCSLRSCKLIMMILNEEASLNNDSQPKPLDTAQRPRTNRPFISYQNTSYQTVAYL